MEGVSPPSPSFPLHACSLGLFDIIAHSESDWKLISSDFCGFLRAQVIHKGTASNPLSSLKKHINIQGFDVRTIKIFSQGSETWKKLSLGRNQTMTLTNMTAENCCVI